MIHETQTNLNNISLLSSKLVEISETIQTSAVRHPQVRWFYKNVTEKRWTPFAGCDSLNLEVEYTTQLRKSHGALNISWPSDLDFCLTREQHHCGERFSTPVGNSEGTRVSVMGGLFDVDLENRTCTPVYWTADKQPVSVLRGTWFRDLGTGIFEPLEDEAMVQQLEVEYSRHYLKNDSKMTALESDSVNPNNKSGDLKSNAHLTRRMLQSVASAPMLFDDCTSASDVNCAANQSCDKRADSVFPLTVSTGSSSVDAKRKLPQHTVRFLDCHVDFYGPEEVYLYQDSTTLYIRQKLGMQKGYIIVFSVDLLSSLCSHLSDTSSCNHGAHLNLFSKINKLELYFHSYSLRESCAKLKAKYFGAPEYAGERVEFLPVEWRSSLQLDGDTVDSITPVHVRGLRTTLNSSAMDIMYYTSPLYRAEISASLLTELNRLYAMFCLRNPLFESRGGRVSVIAHSLGCVLIYDLITGWSQPVYNPTSPMRNRRSPKSDLPTSECQENTGTDRQMRTSTTDFTHSSRISKGSVALGRDMSSQKLHRLAQLSLQLEAARTDSSRPHSPPSATTTAATAPDVTCSYFTTNSLLFKDNLENFFCLGSPLSVFLTLRGIRPGAYVTQDNVLPRRLCPRIFNIYHPADPVPRPPAQDVGSPQLAVTKLDHQDCDSLSTNRLSFNSEICRNSLASRVLGFFTRSAVELSSPSTLRSDDNHSKQTVDNTAVESSQAVPDGDVVSNPVNHSPSEFQNDSLESVVNFDVTNGGNIFATSEDMGASDNNTLNEDQLEVHLTDDSLQLEHRLDYQLCASRYENFYISILTSHTSYWSNADVGLFILTHLFRSAKPVSPAGPCNSSNLSVANRF
ncbi:hypothetical protein PHET_01896 [Paragonimus heterotremus]|uniref:DDHD domain-containing protein n=1 Tax=Paragonimus heterotremus TaxID=100268 RepID=A0A8J4WIS2_9TREM|nr:hypothetical protein PHET_01896 [Paragonimus heterotremus]